MKLIYPFIKYYDDRHVWEHLKFWLISGCVLLSILTICIWCWIYGAGWNRVTRRLTPRKTLTCSVDLSNQPPIPPEGINDNYSMGEIGWASWYSRKSCLKESGQCIMANGRRLDDEDYTAAIWDKEFGAILEVTNLDTNTKVKVEVTDRGPAKRLVKEGRIIDLSMAAFKKICPLSQGLCKVKVSDTH